ncbi:MAG: hypothetical protein C0592_13980 [Marinilabiliales bacterium]|nr:MAG: hypothetical protein C0592_13980 [Marinilabiliales bacterium]
MYRILWCRHIIASGLNYGVIIRNYRAITFLNGGFTGLNATEQTDTGQKIQPSPTGKSRKSA